MRVLTNFTHRNSANLSRWLGLLILPLMMLWGVTASGQVATGYVFSESVGTYTPITGGTVLASCSPCSADQFDEQIYSITLPNAITYNGASVTSIGMSVNGYLIVGGTTGLGLAPISSSTTGVGCIAAFGVDLTSSDNTGMAFEMRWEETSTEYVFQWSDVSRYLVIDELSFQIRIHKTSGAINIVYEAPVVVANSTTRTPQVGLRGNSNSDYNARRLTTTVPDSSPSWVGPDGTTAASSNAHNVRFTSGSPAAFPASGLTFTWTPPTDAVDWCNLQHPPSGSINEGGTFDVYGQAWEPGVTDAPGQAAGLNAWLGYSTSNTNPNTWINWVPATFNAQVGNNDEFVATLSGLPIGTYYYAYRYQLNGGPFRYGGYSPPPGGGFWDGTTYVSGVLTVNCSATVSSFPYLEDFETGTGNWTNQSIAGTEGWVRGTPNKGGITTANSGTNAMVTSSLTANYGNSQTFALRSPCFDLSSITCAPVLSFWMNMQTEADYDAMDVEYSTNGGSTWIKLGAIASNWYNSTSTLGPISQPKFSGTTTASGWQQKSIQLPGALIGQPNVRIRLRFGSDSSTGYAGFAIDDIELKAGTADASLSNLMPPAAACSLSASETVTVQVNNVTCPSIPAGAASVMLAWTGASSGNATLSNTAEIAAGGNEVLTFTGIDLSADGDYSFTATLTYAGDPVSSNNTATGNTTNRVVPVVTAAATDTDLCAGESTDLSASATASQLVAFSDNFNAGTANWTTINNSTGGTPADAAWTIRTSPYIYSSTTFNSGDAQFFLSNSDDQGSGGITNTILQSIAFSTVGYTSLNLDFRHYYRDIADAGDNAFVEASTNAIDWTPLQTYTTTQGALTAFASASINMDAYVNNPTLYIRFRYVATWDYYWAIDNVIVSGVGTAYDYSWTSNPAGFTSSVEDPGTVTPAVTTTYTVQITTPDNCTAQHSVTVNVTPLTTWYEDADNDGFGDPAVSQMSCTQPSGYVANNTDLCPTDANKQAPGACGCGVADVATTWYADTDNDGFGDPNNSIPGFTCDQPSGYVANNTDLCPADPNKQAPGACGCGVADTDTDGDNTPDCDDGCPNDPNKTAPGACGCGVADVATTWYADTDGDTYGDPNNSIPGFTCDQPTGYVANNTDCDDTNNAINPGATEVVNGIDDNCNGMIDETGITYYRDMDGDGFGDPNNSMLAGSPPTGYVLDNTDCNDNNALEKPGQTWYKDTDGDNYAETGAVTIIQCTRPTGYKAASELTATTGDCNDNNAAINPGATEVCNGIDDDCDGSTDEGVLTTYYLDADGDGYYTGAPVTACTSPGAGYVTSVTGGGDCNDGNDDINPGANELCNGIDDNCNGSTDEGFDADNDGIADCFDNCPNTPNSVIRPIAIDGNIGDFGAPIANGNAGVNYYFSADNDYFYVGVTGVNLGNDNLHIAFSNADGSTTADNWGVNWSNTPYTYLITVFGPDDICYYPFNDPYGCQQVGNGGGQWQHFAGWSGNPTTEIRIPRAYLGSLNGSSGLVNLTIYSNNNSGTYVWTGYPTSNPQGNAPVTWNSFGQQAYPTYLPQVDADNDGFGAACDCNDNNANINPNAAEVCDGIDNDCDSMIDEGLSFTTYYVDNDGDGFGTGNGQSLCSNPGVGYSTVAGDCNDNNANINPNAAEVCDGIDNDCDSMIDEGLSFTTYYVDNDGDGFGTGNGQSLCSNPGAGYSTVAGDCNDNNANINPNAAEVCDGIDNDCDSMIDEGLSFTTYYVDNDGDGFGTGNGQSLCSNPGAGYSTVAGDCNDNNANINPNAAEVCDGIDNDCDSMIDEGLSFTTYYVDNDGDGFGTGNGQSLCSNPGAGYSTVAGDCNDNNANINPNAAEVCDGIDNDCDGLVDSADPNYVDNTPPTVTCASQATLNFNGQTDIQIDGVSPVNLQIVANDNCGIASTMISPSTITASQVGQAVPVTITVTDGKGNTAQCVTTVNVSGLPAGWSSTPAGVGCAGGNNVGYNTGTGTWTVTSTNCFYGPPFTGDSEAFAQRTLCGDGSITVLVTGINPLAGGWAGIVMRESNAAGAKKAQLMTNLGSDHRREFRTVTNGTVIPQQFSSLSRYWLRIVRTGNQFTLFVSSTGMSWFPAGAQNIVMSNCIEMGLIVTNYTSNSTVTATFSNVSFTQVTPPSVNTINVQPTLGQVEFDVFPNPTSGELNLDLAQYIGRSVRIETYSLEGKLLQFAELDEVQNTLERFDLSRFQNGMYLVKVKSAGLPDVTRRIVKQ